MKRVFQFLVSRQVSDQVCRCKMCRALPPSVSIQVGLTGEKMWNVWGMSSVFTRGGWWEARVRKTGAFRRVRSGFERVGEGVKFYACGRGLRTVLGIGALAAYRGARFDLMYLGKRPR